MARLLIGSKKVRGRGAKITRPALLFTMASTVGARIAHADGRQKVRCFLTGRIARRGNYWYLIYSEVDFRNHN